MPYRQNSPEWIEETICNCGAGHGSGEAHEENCAWLRIEKFAHAANAAREFLSMPALHKMRVQGKMMSRKQVIANL